MADGLLPTNLRVIMPVSKSLAIYGPTITGTGEPGATVSVSGDIDADPGTPEVFINTALVGSDGTWSLTLTSDLPEDTISLSATQTDSFGNTSDPGTGSVVVDANAIARVVIGDPPTPLTPTTNQKPEITGTAEPSDATKTVTVTVTADLDLDGSPDTVLGEVNVEADGTWTLSEYEYNLPVGTVALQATQQIVITEISDGNNAVNTNLTNTSFAGAQPVSSSALVSGVPIMLGGVIAPRATVGLPGGSTLEFPTQPGSIEEPGHRDIPREGSGIHGIPDQVDAPHLGIQEIKYNFRSRYSQNSDLPDLVNTITEEQKVRAREVFEIYSFYTGVRFTETETEGVTVVTGDPRGLSAAEDPGPGLLGLAWLGQLNGNQANNYETGFTMNPGSLSVMNSIQNWGESEFGGNWFDTAMHEIGHNLGLQHSYDLPSNEGRFSPSDLGEEAFPGTYDIAHLLQLYPKLGSDIDVYQFTLDQPGAVTAETIVARPGQEALSQLDTVLTLYQETELNGVITRSMVARNDNSISRDSLLQLDLEAGNYYVVVTSVGNTDFDPEVEESGYGGRSQGAYRLQLEFIERTSIDSSIKDFTGTPLDGDQDGVAGGKHKFWFKTASPDNIKFVDKSATDANATVNDPVDDFTVEFHR